MEIFRKIVSKIIIRLFRPSIIKKWKKDFNNIDLTIISQNCIGGIIYHDLGLQFRSPTINMTIEGENFVRLVNDLEHYMMLSPYPITEKSEDPQKEGAKYPKIGVGDIEICCVHYNSCAEAIEMWERRKKRVNLDNVFVFANSWDLYNNIEYMKQIDKCKYKTLIFTESDVGIKNAININDFFEKNRVKTRPTLMSFIPYSPYRYYEKLFNPIEFLSNPIPPEI